MKWFEVRNKYPNRIILVEALETSSQNHVRTVREMSILSDFQDSLTALQEYKKLHKDRPEKELFLLHTSKEKAEVVEQFFSGIRGIS